MWQDQGSERVIMQKTRGFLILLLGVLEHWWVQGTIHTAVLWQAFLGGFEASAHYSQKYNITSCFTRVKI